MAGGTGRLCNRATVEDGGERLKVIEAYLRFTDWLNAKFAWFVAFLIVPMLAIMVWEIVLRYFFLITQPRTLA